MKTFEEKLKSLYGHPARFENGEEMAKELILCAFDLYCPQTNTYVFCYNTAGSVAVYDWIDEREANKLITYQIENGDYWGASLGPGGNVYDSDSYDPFCDCGDETTSLTGENRGWIDAHFAEGDWYYVNQIEYPENIEKEENEKKEEEKPKMKVKIYPVGNKANHEIEGENTSTIVSELIALAARYCESYASDIVYDINEFINSVVGHIDYEKILLFYDCGVHARTPETFETFMDQHSSSGDRAFFRLSYDSEKNVQKLERLTVYVCRF